MPSQWDHKADKDLLLTIIEAGNLVHIEWQAISAALKAKDYTFSHEACRQHYQKIRKESKKPSADSTTNTPSKPKPKATATPNSRKRSAKTLIQNGDANGVGVDNNNEDDGLNGDTSPSTKRQKSIQNEEKKEMMVDMGGFVGQTAAQFKFETLIGSDGLSRQGAIDLDDGGSYF